SLADKAMVLWASGHAEGFLTPEGKADIIKELRAKQLADGGWSLLTLGDWGRQKGEEQDLTKGDGYATGLAVYALRQAGVAVDDPAVKRGIAWLKKNQRESGRWFTRSVSAPQGRQVITNIGSAFAVMALQACAEGTP